MAVPVIDMGNLDAKDRESIKDQIAKACEEYGFFQLINHGIPHRLLEQVKHVCSVNYKEEREEKFMNESVPLKMLENALEEEAADSNSRELKKMDNVDWEDCFVIQYNQEEFAWPSQPSDFKETMEEFRKEVIKLAETLLEIISENLGQEKDYIKKVFGGPKSQAFFGTKISHFPACPRPDLFMGLRSHTDAGGLILLFQDDQVGGLQILNNDKWIGVQPMSNSIVIDVGDQLEAISNGKYKSAWHRVLVSEKGNRRSVASFYNPSYDAIISPVEQKPKIIESNDNGCDSSLYPRFVYGDYMNVYAEQKYLPKDPRFQAMKTLV
ncbi:hypothetical protein SUGI_0565450 [Cryptomeria japonica]|uniref:1-aminocyclopropane-1-carboxylate oxidase n=1 Tax=Cryptomeria japonica TaxID=3369 RepID=UPI002408A952|nr:1-aminocyclopropane-1-carboxylate oxidase [Cryptomeria japonica]GLJ28694.1 hypothetical protein SUGI_0565450 [Cryptomeria japonica]